MSSRVLLRSKAAFSAACHDAREKGLSVGLVPTMGALHAGHGALIRSVQRHVDRVAVTCFVNPLQFDDAADLEAYPRTLDRDVAFCEALGVEWVFAPSQAEMYPAPPLATSQVSILSEPWEGASRPGHFEGVATIVQKLFHLAGPCTAAFGQKDFQQCRVIERLIEDFDIPVRVLRHPIVRESDGLALSSRNQRLTDTARARASALPQALAAVRSLHGKGEREAKVLQEAMQDALSSAFDAVDYAALANPDTLAPVSGATTRPVVVLAAVRIDGVRLIDNTLLDQADPELDSLQLLSP